MVSSVERIEQDIAALDKTLMEISTEFHQGYREYLKALGETVRKQLVLAGYHVCTQGYPDQFLTLSVTQRQVLQQSLRQLAQQVQTNLLEALHEPGTASPANVEPSALNPLRTEPIVAARDEFAIAPELSEFMPEAFSLDASDLIANPAHPPAPEADLSLTPERLAEWQEALEQAIVKELRIASHHANRHLQQAGILPKKLPDFLLQTASKSDMADLPTQSSNLLNVLVEASDRPSDDGDEDRDSRSTLVHVVAIHLRLSEIEFAEPTVTLIRNRLRSLSARLKVLSKQARKKQQERAIAQAQDAWRASWFEES